jgi:hypothetical protein
MSKGDKTTVLATQVLVIQVLGTQVLVTQVLVTRVLVIQVFCFIEHCVDLLCKLSGPDNMSEKIL